MKKYIAGAVLSLGILLSPAFTQAATITEPQIQAIISLLTSFGADPAAISNVDAALRGQIPTTPVPIPTPQPIFSCISLNNNLYADVTDATTDGEVSLLQKFLGGRVTGYFGPATLVLVQNWQAAHGVVSSGSPDTTGYGYVGPKTRAAMSCSSTVPPSNNTRLSVTVPTSVVIGSSYTIEWGDLSGPTLAELARAYPTALGEMIAYHSDQSLGVAQTVFRDVPIGILLNGNTTWQVGALTNDGRQLPSGKYSVAFYVSVPNGGNLTGIAQGNSAVFVVSTAPSNSSITVTSPNGGEQWEQGVMNTITWTPYGYNPDVNPASGVSAYLLKDVVFHPGSSATYSNIGQIVPVGKASIHWEGQIKVNAEGTIIFPEPGQYSIMVVNNKTGVNDISDAPFTILPKPIDMKVNGSDGPLTLAYNQKITIGWTSTGMSGCSLISGARLAETPPTTTEGLLPTHGSVQAWSDGVSITFGCKKFGTGQYVYDSVLVNATGIPASLQITSPNGGELITVNDITQVKIAWRMDGISTPISIALYKNDKWLSWIEKSLGLDKSLEGTYSYVWAPNAKGPALPALDSGVNSGFKIYITGQKADGTGYVEDKSDAPFGFVSGSAVNSVQLKSVVVTSGSVRVQYTKNFDTCVHLVDQNSKLLHVQNYFCATDANEISVPSPSDLSPNIQIGQQVRLCHGNNYGICSQAVTVTVQPAGTGTLSAISSSVASANIVAGSSNVLAGQFPFSAQNTSYTVQNLSLYVPGAGGNSVQSIMLKYKDKGGNTQTATAIPVYDSGKGFSVATFTGLSMYIPTNDSRILDVYINTLSIGSGAVSGAPINVVLDTGSASLSSKFRAVDYTSGLSLTQINSGMPLASNSTLYIRKSLPTFSTLGIGTYVAGAPIYKFSITADPAGDIEWSRLALNTTVGTITNAFLTDANSGTVLTGVPVSSSNIIINLRVPSVIPAGTTRTYNLYGILSGLASGSSATLSLTPDKSPVTNTVAASVIGNVVWSDRSSAYTIHSLTTPDWTNGYLLKDFSGFVQIQASAAPTITMTQSKSTTVAGEQFTITWSSTNANSCTFGKTIPDGTWVDIALGNSGVSGTYTATPVLPGTHTWYLTCTNANGVTKESVAHTVTAANQTASALNAFNDAANASVPQSMTGFTYAWNRDLQIGSPYFADVNALQTALAREQVYAGEITGGFYSQTFFAVKTFQQKYGIESTGFVGPDTRALLNTLYSN